MTYIRRKHPFATIAVRLWQIQTPNIGFATMLPQMAIGLQAICSVILLQSLFLRVFAAVTKTFLRQSISADGKHSFTLLPVQIVISKTPL
jgi:hypothetical protein